MFIFSLVVIEEALYLQRKQSCNDYKVERSKQMKAYDILLAHQIGRASCRERVYVLG